MTQARPAQSQVTTGCNRERSILYSAKQQHSCASTAHAPCGLLQAICGHNAQCYIVRLSTCRSARHTASSPSQPTIAQIHLCCAAACRRLSCAGCRSAAGSWTRRQSSQGANPAAGVMQPCSAVQLAFSSRIVGPGRPHTTAATSQRAALCTFAQLEPAQWMGLPMRSCSCGECLQLDRGQQIPGDGLHQPCHLPAAPTGRVCSSHECTPQSSQ